MGNTIQEVGNFTKDIHRLIAEPVEELKIVEDERVVNRLDEEIYPFRTHDVVEFVHRDSCVIVQIGEWLFSNEEKLEFLKINNAEDIECVQNSYYKIGTDYLTSRFFFKTNSINGGGRFRSQQDNELFKKAESIRNTEEEGKYVSFLLKIVEQKNLGRRGNTEKKAIESFRELHKGSPYVESIIKAELPDQDAVLRVNREHYEGIKRVIYLSDIHLDYIKFFRTPNSYFNTYISKMRDIEFRCGIDGFSTQLNQNVIRGIGKTEVLLVISGDITNFGTKAEFYLFRLFLCKLGYTNCLVVPGNHDVATMYGNGIYTNYQLRNFLRIICGFEEEDPAIIRSYFPRRCLVNCDLNEEGVNVDGGLNSFLVLLVNSCEMGCFSTAGGIISESDWFKIVSLSSARSEEHFQLYGVPSTCLVMHHDIIPNHEPVSNSVADYIKNDQCRMKHKYKMVNGLNDLRENVEYTFKYCVTGHLHMNCQETHGGIVYTVLNNFVGDDKFFCVKTLDHYVHVSERVVHTLGEEELEETGVPELGGNRMLNECVN